MPNFPESTKMTNTLAEITTWHQRARPNPTDAAFNAQMGCHFEEILEMVECLRSVSPVTTHCLQAITDNLVWLSMGLKRGEVQVFAPGREELLDSLADQIVTAVGVGHCAHMDVTEACKVVNFSNWSKFGTDGLPIFSEGGKILKGSGYVQPDLSGLF